MMFKKLWYLGYNDSDVMEFPFDYNTTDTMLGFDCIDIDSTELAEPVCVVRALACMSLILTMVNIICILLFGWLVLWLKEVTPDKVPQAFAYFWKRDVKITEN